MNSELLRYSTGRLSVPRRDREVAQAAKRIHDEVRLKSLEADGAIALAGHLMEGLVELDKYRRQLAGDDPITNQMLGAVQMMAVQQATSIQRGLFNQWGI